MAEDTSYVYALHDFEAENADELSFVAGERIRVLQRDELYSDGWFEGRNTAGEIGLFPQSYTSPDPPSPGSPLPDNPREANGGDHTPEPQIAATMNEVQQALSRLEVERQSTAKSLKDSISMRSADRVSLRTKDASDDDDTGPINGNETSPSKGMGSNHRAALAAKAVANAEKAAKEEQERAERRRKDDVAAYEKARKEGLIEDLQLSEESSEEEELPLPVGMKSTLTRAPESIELPSSPIVDESTSPVITVDEPNSGGEGRPRAGTVSSGYAESTYSTQSVQPVASPPALHEVSTLPSTEIPEDAEDAQEELKEEAAVAPSQSNGDHSTLDSAKHSAVEAVDAVGAGVIGVGAAAAAAVGLSLDSKKDEPSAIEASLPKEAEIPIDQSTATPLEATNPIPSHIVTAPSPVVPPPASPPAAQRAVTPPPAAATPAPIVTATDPIHASPAASLTSATHSRSSSRLGMAPLTAGSIATIDTSPHGSANGSKTAPPHDPTLWSVDDVVEWGRGKGFDNLTLSKFQEHEISGDVLLEMDVAMLKEIDLIAFGRRVHIYNAIKELKARVPKPARADVASPSLSGYEPDSPGNLSFASPGQASFSSPPEDVQGLGFEDDTSSIARPTSSLARSVNSLQPRRSTGAISSTQASPTTHKRSVTGGTQDSAAQDSLDQPIPEEDNETDTQSGSNKTPIIAALPAVAAAAAAAAAASTSRSDSTRGKSKPASRRSGTDKSDTSAPPSPVITRKKKDSGASDRSSMFFGAALGRNRKPPPRVPSALLVDSDGRVARPGSSSGDAKSTRARMALNASKRTTRLFGSFGGSGSEKNAGIENLRKTSTSTLGSPRDAPSSMSPRVVDVASSEMTSAQPDAVTDGSNLLERIGTPDYTGWMQKKGEKYNSWKPRFFVLKGIHLYWLKGEGEQKAKGFINLRGYRVISDPNVHVGQFGFKIVHDHERPHFFSAAEQVTIRTWMKEIMKATIGRDYSEVVVSSCDMDTMPLSVAQSMNPRPRPPSPTERARVQRERYAGTNPNTLTPKDAQILMEFSPGSPLMGGTGFATPPASGIRRSSSSNANTTLSQLAVDPEPTATTPAVVPTAAPVASPVSPTKSLQRKSSSDQELLAWVNASLPSSTPLATDLSDSLRSGRILVRLVENLSGKNANISNAEFDKYQPPAKKGQPFDPEYFDTVFNGEFL
ncbi:hypothetical protein BCR35DRAFT_299255 [Leucosporidium creatinivorum]|uniref:Uncharacterized protein n=1 Tax=Leucosporidium creatinivorum TaxID=106004 RepID=A0A1Y2G2L7_9BASI|nr:hypothetical protein BCR35DRAFT_299255 [Leucosporidium creatinivorum]